MNKPRAVNQLRGRPTARGRDSLRTTGSDRRVSRRSFLRLTGCVIGAGLAGRLLWTRSDLAYKVLPPGAIAKTEFGAFCIRCGKCAASCDRRAIKLDETGLPYLDGINGWCDLCMVCAEACPSGALIPIEPSGAIIGTAVINRDRCIAWQRVGCRLCAVKCADLQQAIWIDEAYHPHVDAAACNGCGACVFVCPQPSEIAGDRRQGKAIAVQPL